MKENTNKAIAVNSAILYVRMVITTICSVLTTRYALQALGIVDFGLFALLGGIITFVSIFNNIMLTTSNRFIAVAIGKGDATEINRQFNVNVVIHVLIALITAVIAFPIGDWYINHFVNYDGDMGKALVVFNISIAASIFSFVGVPYNGLLMAKEKFLVFSCADVLSHIGRLIVACVLITHFDEKLLIYTAAMAFFTIAPVFWYIQYCHTHYGDIVKWHLVKDGSRYKAVFGFSMWVSVGAVATIGKSQGAALLINAFFSTIMNTALGIANSVCAYLNLFSQTVTQPMAPQITKSYASGDTERTNELLLMSTKYAFLLMLLASTPFLVAPEWILGLWLGQVPPYSKVFLVLLIVDGLVQSLNTGVSNIIFASGRIKMYQVVTSLLNILSIFLGFIVLYFGAPAYYLLAVYIAMSALRVVLVQWILHRTLNYDNSMLISKSYFPCMKVCILFVPLALLLNFVSISFLRLIVSMGGLCAISYFAGLSPKERLQLTKQLKRHL